MHGAGAADLLTAAIAALVVIAIAGALYTHRFGLSHLLVFMAVGMLAGVDGPLGLPGIAGVAAVQVGNLVNPINPNSPALTTISTVDPIRVWFTAGEQEYLKTIRGTLIANGQSPSAKKIELELVLSDGTVYPHKGQFYMADRNVDQKTGSIKLAGLFPNPGNTLRPGEYGRVRAIISTRAGALLVPHGC